ncbi:unnamed protein product [Fusarium graminearum]|uniref:Chromosome 3, complete genome n=2 Tax=Gibberella zeae TaxID=5518 RepID=A0A0E0SL60_GIBZE|nr:hypothetical protein FG05_35324 [Fusarium graminearum]CAF3464267.1 unnamed protein product [Fusarium graminearum]CAF3586290.1 unnamed protein product [Fusarium graminearum]CAG1969676.1 unnamed protein product [Fusarium graminearum]CAG1987183.1 unnamed protein product [Fusarium graminearum]
MVDSTLVGLFDQQAVIVVSSFFNGNVPRPGKRYNIVSRGVVNASQRQKVNTTDQPRSLEFELETS